MIRGLALRKTVFAPLALLLTAGVHPAENEQRLAFLVGDWTIEGHEADYRETCRWWHDNSFVICETQDRTEGEAVHSVSLFGWSAAARHYTYHHYAQTGRSRSETCLAHDQGGLTCLGQRDTDTGQVRTRSRVWPVEGGLQFVAERSLNGGDWQESVRLKYVPRRP